MKTLSNLTKRNNLLHIGLDIGSTTVKSVVIDYNGKVLFSAYKRHLSDLQNTVEKIFDEILQTIPPNSLTTIAITGSGGLSLAKNTNLNFCQEVIASTKAVENLIPQTDVAIELGGEDAKITYFKPSLEQRMNGTCAGGTGAFIDQMASLLQTDALGLNELAQEHTTLYPIAARCGVFAKTDVQPLLNEGAKREDIAASILQAVVNQTISGLACGHPIKGKVAFLGGPLFFLPQLRKRFIKTLNLSHADAIIPDNAQLFVALGAAFTSKFSIPLYLNTIVQRIKDAKQIDSQEIQRLDPLFENEEQYQNFKNQHNIYAPRKNIQEHQGPCFLGIDAGSTTSKIVLIDENANILYQHYDGNNAKPLEKVIQELKKLYTLLPEKAYIKASCVTGYGELLIKQALNCDFGEIETIAHYKAAAHFQPDLNFILDIGGQDMKCLTIHDGVIDNIILNEACSSGCGSFIETFAKSLGSTSQEFAKQALFAKAPVDLGTRCTVFMNSRVKQAQKEGATVADISAGLAYSVIKNALYKVIKFRNSDAIGKKLVVQGGTFLNDAILRAFEKVAGVKALRPDIAGLMGAFGAALLAKERSETQYSSLKSYEQLQNLEIKVSMQRCGKCTNNCLLTINDFGNGQKFISGNRCEKPLEIKTQKKQVPNLFEYKHKRTFNYKPLAPQEAKLGTIGIPRVLNLYENYPFWFTLFTNLGFRVLISPPSTKTIYEAGMDSIPSESACYPAKLVHGHIMYLIDKKPDIIFYPCIPYEEHENKATTNHYNCPIVTSYPELIKNNIEELRQNNITFLNPFFNLNDRKSLYKRIYDELKAYVPLSIEQVKLATELAFNERDNYKKDIQTQGEKTLEYIKKNNLQAIVLAGRPYHIDKEINHGLPELITSYGIPVLTEDSIAHLTPYPKELRVFDQWTYHSRLYAAAKFVSTQEHIELIQLNSFGCGLDAVTTDQVHELLASEGKIFTCLKIDEGNNIAAANIRIRSLIAAIAERKKHGIVPKKQPIVYNNITFTKKMAKDYTILAPQMSPIHFQFIESAFHYAGYNLQILPDVDHNAVEEGLKYVNNDACYPSIITTGQIIKALKSGKYDINKTAVVISQTGGGCRATNYIAFIRKALKEAGLENIPVIALSAQGFEKHPGFKLTPALLHRAMQALVYGDILMQVLYKTRPYELEKNSANALYQKWVEQCKNNLKKASHKIFKQTCEKIIYDFDQLPLKNITKPKVGLVGEILVKFHPTANNQIVELLEAEGAEAVMPGLLGFIYYTLYDTSYQHTHLGRSFTPRLVANTIIKIMDFYMKTAQDALMKSHRFDPAPSVQALAKLTKPILQLGNQTGEGWFLTGEMLELLHSGVNNIICMQPFACLPNHVTGKGMIKKLRQLHPKANIAAIDYDPGASEVNQLNRIKLMLSVAFKNINGNDPISLQPMTTDETQRVSICKQFSSN